MAILAVLVAVGAGAEWLFRRWLGTGSAAAEAEGDTAERPVKLLSEFVPLVVFALASAGLFLMFEWPPLLRLFVLTFLSAVIAFRTVRTVKRRTAQAAPILSRFGGAPAAPRRSAGYVLVHPGCRLSPGSSCSAGRWSA